MSRIRFLGAHGGRAQSAKTTCLQVTPTTLIDAGHIMGGLTEAEALSIERIFLTHAHLDHILDIAFFIDHFFARRQFPLKIYGLPDTLAALRQHFFNEAIWPDFTLIDLPGLNNRAIELVELSMDVPVDVDQGICLTPIPSHHTVACCGYVIESSAGAMVFGGDGWKNPALWQRVNADPAIHSVVIDVSFPDRLRSVAEKSRHLTPTLLVEDMKALTRSDVSVYAWHIKPAFADEIFQEWTGLGLSASHLLTEGDELDLASGQKLAAASAGQSHGSVDGMDRVARLNQIGVALSAEKDLAVLLENILAEAKNLTHADGGTLYLLEDDALHFTVAQTDSLGIRMGGTSEPISWEPLPLKLADGAPNKKMVAATSALENRVINIEDVYHADGFSFEGAKKFDEAMGYRSKSMLVIPLRNYEETVIGVLQLLNRQDANGQTCAFGKEDEQITLSLASQAAVALTNARLIDDLENLLESFLGSIIYMMGRKSEYTAGHINRMVALSEMFADAIHKDATFFPDKFYSKEDAHMIRMAALMHDIGKLATPETVMDKATKLDGHFDRIELVEQRAQTVRANLHNARLVQALDQKNDRADSQAEKIDWDAELRRLDEGMALVRKSNEGGEFLPDEQSRAIQALAETPFPVQTGPKTLLTQEEADYLKVQKGTLTEAERQIIMEHAQIGLDVLEQLPFPEKYKNIPHVAGAHHEKLNGKGYPLGLKAEEISFDARILAIADIFEALTAFDRPYKKANPLSVAMKIMGFMVKDGELDPKLVRFFIESGLYQQYAERYLPESSRDDIDVDFSEWPEG
ncbi:HD domain-containing phosphohydrolase [Thiomicrospira sp. WB1]|uniref:HD domain-containing phosphohydrolase n=1 Tax=Thiomicrospira sp. WB1 TaxID=1685380 RepID=UPI00074A302A|nr:HD domain-containing phosphohydrolase [Thiomicrospira sp. WB1]KUJ72690.1 phosphohydrolase [Thiomicrospira sp. WB1]